MKSPDLSIFQTVTSERWHKEARKQLKGKDPNSELIWDSLGLHEIKPYYDESDLKNLSDQINFFKQLPGHFWKLYEKVNVEDEKSANEKALAALTGGCDGIIFKPSAEVNVDLLLKGIDLTLCDISIDQHIDGAVGMNSKNCLTLINASTPAKQINDLLSKKRDYHEWILRQSFKDFFVEIASVRALRYLLNNEKHGESIKIHTSILKHEWADHQWFLNTTAGLASILGGSYSIDFPTAEGDSRISRNVGNIIREESGIDQYEDQCGGSFFVESLTNQIIQKVRNQK